MLPKQCNTAEEQAQTRRDDYRGKQCTTWVGMTLPSAPRHLLASALLPEMAQHFRVTRSTMVRAAIPTPSTAPVTGRCTSYGTLHPIRTGALPTDRVQHPCPQAQPRTKPLRTPTSTQREQTRPNEMTATAPARIADNNPYRATLPSYQIEGSTPFESNPYQTRTQTRKHSPAHTTHTIRPAVLQVPARTNPSPQPYVVAHRKPQKIDSPQPS